MARPAKSAAVSSRNISNEEKQIRAAKESELRGSCDSLKPPKHLTTPQKKIFKAIVEDMKSANVLGNIDVYILATCAIALERITAIEQEINEAPEAERRQLLSNNTLMLTKNRYTNEFFRCCNELCMSPQSRAKMGTMAAAEKEKKNPLLEALAGAGDDDDED